MYTPQQENSKVNRQKKSGQLQGSNKASLEPKAKKPKKKKKKTHKKKEVEKTGTTGVRGGKTRKVANQTRTSFMI
jgi:hypothetical protein